MMAIWVRNIVGILCGVLFQEGRFVTVVEFACQRFTHGKDRVEPERAVIPRGIRHSGLPLDSALNVVVFARGRTPLRAFAHTLNAAEEEISNLPHMSVVWNVIVVAGVLYVRDRPHVLHLPVIGRAGGICGVDCTQCVAAGGARARLCRE